MAKAKSQSQQYELEQKLIRVQRSTGTQFPTFIRLHNWFRMHSDLYYNWHLLSWSRNTHWVLLIFHSLVVVAVMAIVIGGLLAIYINAITRSLGN